MHVAMEPVKKLWLSLRKEVESRFALPVEAEMFTKVAKRIVPTNAKQASNWAACSFASWSNAAWQL